MGSSSSDTPHYENVPFEVPENWEWTNLGEITNYGNCENVDVNDIPSNGWVLELEDLEKDSAKIIQRLTKDERDIKGVRHSFHKGDVLYSKLRTYLNKVMVAPEDGFCTTEIIPVTCMSFILPEYLNHVLRSKYFVDYTIQCGYGVKMPRLSTTDACNGQIPLPPYNEQKHIVASIESWFQIIDILESDKLDLDEAIQKTKSKILNLAIHGKLVPQDANDEPASELLKRINPKAVASCDNPHCLYIFPIYWELVKLEDVCEFIRNGVSIRQIKGANGIPITRIETISNGIVDRDRMGYADIIDDTYEKYYLQHGDILMSHINSPIHVGKSALYESIEGEKIIHGMNLLCLRMKTGICPKYMNYLFMSEIFKDEIRPYIKNAVNQASINTRNLGGVYSPIPPYNEQQRIVTKIEELFAVLDEIQKSIEA